MTNLVLTFPDIDPVAIRIFGLQIHWYALMYLLAFVIAYLLMRARLKHEPFRSITEPAPYTSGVIEDILAYAILGVLVGGRLGYTFFYKPGYYLTHPLEIFMLWEGGMSFHGGVIGVVLAMAWLAWRKKRPFLQVTDFLVPSIPLGLAAGRIGNFINGELWGRPAPEGLPWAMVIPTGGDVARHPSQIYQALLEGVLLFVILWLFARRNRYRGQVSGLFLAGYGLFRFIGEFFREPDAHLGYLGLGMSMGQWLSLPMLLAGVILFSWATARKIDDRQDPVAAVDNPAENEVQTDDEKLQGTVDEQSVSDADERVSEDQTSSGDEKL
ncbi:prolipoprotein diacylglyceryl transferase [Tessaracoccus oleiagri]|uniref:Phosphatidylglycerol--prolipoprotein diacylglyceryl transferase n=1 Tax=Tessaracoccus oleiagri TaxID=686624 RepID=A0A1G9I438_9ACTN|nr:prolipoprotein diacylglyceryl transferase [Tessaracoccus oleiagri]SDL19852.1 phosphatidylglycerol:prolipoprotein diacylglycerol transferase [Tessaracoccus oleiagri]